MTETQAKYGGPITYEDSIKAAREELAKAAEAGENLLMPSDSLNNVPAMHKVSVERIKLSPKTEDKDVYPQGSGGTDDDGESKQRYALTKDGLLKLSSCAGVQWDYDHSGRIDNMSDPNYIAWRMVGAIQKLDGSWLPLQGSYDLDMMVIHEDLLELYKRKCKNWKNLNAEGKEAYADGEAKKELLKIKRHKVARVETGAMLRAIRGLLNVKGTYSIAEIQKPFVIARLVFQPDYADPIIKAQAVALAFKAMQGVYGIQAPSFPQPRQLPAKVVDLESNGNGGYGMADPIDPEPEPEPEPQDFGAPDPVEVARSDFKGCNKKGKLEMINTLIKRKGYDTSKLKSPLANYPEEKLEPFFEHLLALPDKVADDDIPL